MGSPQMWRIGNTFGKQKILKEIGATCFPRYRQWFIAQFRCWDVYDTVKESLSTEFTKFYLTDYINGYAPGGKPKPANCNIPNSKTD